MLLHLLSLWKLEKTLKDDCGLWTSAPARDARAYVALTFRASRSRVHHLPLRAICRQVRSCGAACGCALGLALSATRSNEEAPSDECCAAVVFGGGCCCSSRAFYTSFLFLLTVLAVGGAFP